MKADAILTSDWHIMENTPPCRKDDDFLDTQVKKVRFITDLQQENGGCPIFHTGDLLERWKSSPFILSLLINLLPDEFYTILGNHDMPRHSLELVDKSGVFTLFAAGSLEEAKGKWWTMDNPPDEDIEINNKKILLAHEMVWQHDPPVKGLEGHKAIDYLKKYYRYDLIVTGHNHQSFVKKYKGRLLVNPGSLTRHKADQIDHKPSVYLWYAKTNTVKRVFLPFEPASKVMSRDHIEIEKRKNKRLEAFIDSIQKGWKASISFEANLKSIKKSKRVEAILEDIFDEIRNRTKSK